MAARFDTRALRAQSAASSTSSGRLGTGGMKTTPAMGSAMTVQSSHSRAKSLDAGGSGHFVRCRASAGFPVKRAVSTSAQQELAQL